MQTAGSTGPSRTGYGTDGPAGPPSIKLEEDLAGPAALAAQAGPAAPEGVRQALLTGLKRDAEAARLSLKQEEMAEPEPVKRRRRRKGIRDPRLQLNEDVMARVLPYLAKTSVRHLLILSMVNRDLYEQVTEAHAIWRRTRSEQGSVHAGHGGARDLAAAVPGLGEPDLLARRAVAGLRVRRAVPAGLGARVGLCSRDSRDRPRARWPVFTHYTKFDNFSRTSFEVR